MPLNAYTDRARGYMLLGIIYMHALIAFASVREFDAIAASFVQIKLLSPHVTVFFLLSGMGARQLGRRGFWKVFRQAAALVLLAIVSHVTGFILIAALHGTGTDLAGATRMLLGPIVYGTGFSTFVAWFFLSLAVARVLTYLLYRSRRAFALVVAVLAAIILVSQQLGLPDNIFEWRTWPPAFLFFLIGTRIPHGLAIPLPIGLAAGAGSLALTWFNRPGLLWEGPCLTCDVLFVSQPMVGGFGSFPVFLAQELLFFAFLVSIARLERPAWITRPADFIGQNSARFLLLNGWVIVALNPWVLPLLPTGDSLPLFVGLLVGGTVLHRGLFRLLKKPLGLMVSGSFQAVDLVASLPQALRTMRLTAGRSS